MLKSVSRSVFFEFEKENIVLFLLSLVYLCIGWKSVAHSSCLCLFVQRDSNTFLVNILMLRIVQTVLDVAVVC